MKFVCVLGQSGCGKSTLLQDLLVELCSKQQPEKTVFFVTHDVDEAILIANRILVPGQSPSNVIYDCKIVCLNADRTDSPPKLSGPRNIS